MAILHRVIQTMQTACLRPGMRLVLTFCFVSMIFICCNRGVKNQPWQETPGFKKREMIRPGLSGRWTGEEWSTLVISRSGRDSIRGIAEGGTIRFRGELRGVRADIAGADGESGPIYGYMIRKHGTDSLIVGLRDGSGTWQRFFTLIAADGGNDDD